MPSNAKTKMPAGLQSGDINSYESRIFWSVCAAALLRLSAGYIPYERLWGLNYLSGFGMPWDLAFTTAAILVALPAVQRRIVSIVLSRASVAGKSDRRFGAASLLFVLLAVAALVWPMQTFFYGDGGLLIPQMHKLAAGEPMQLDILLNYKSSPLAGALLLAIARGWPGLLDFLSLPMPATALYPFPLLGAFSALALAVFFFVYKESPQKKLGQALLCISGAGALLYFGYAEFYLPVHVSVCVYLCLAERRMRRGGPDWPLFVAFILAVASHYYAIALLPSLMYAIRHDAARGVVPGPLGNSLPRVFLVIAFAAIALAAVTWSLDGDSRILMPLTAHETEAGTVWYTLLSRYHLVDLVNLLFLLAPFALPLLALSWRRVFHREDDRVIRFHALATYPFLLFLFFANASLGLARDWDLAAPAAPLLAFLIAAIVQSGIASEGRGARPGAAAVALGSIGVVFTLPWILLHLDSDATAARFERLLALDAGHMVRDNALSGYEALRKYHRNAGNTEKDLELGKKKIEILDYPSHYNELLAKTSALASTNRSRAIDLRRWMLERLRRRASELRAQKRQRDYAISVSQIDSLAEAIAFTSYLERLYPDLEVSLRALAHSTGAVFPPPVITALRLYEEKQYAAAGDAIQLVLERGFADPRLYLILGTSLALTARYTEALRVFESGVARYPDDTPLLFTLARAYTQNKLHPDRAQAYLVRCLEIGVSPAREQEIQGLLRTLRGY